MKKFISLASYDDNGDPMFDDVCFPVDSFLRFEIHHHFTMGYYAVVGLHNEEGLSHIELKEMPDHGVLTVFIGSNEECAEFLRDEIGVLPSHYTMTQTDRVLASL